MPQSSSAQEAASTFGQRLRTLRKTHGISGRELARRTGWSTTKISRVENGQRMPCDADIRLWAAHCGAQSQAEDLVAMATGIKGMYVDWRSMEKTGLRVAQETSLQQWEKTHKFKAYSHSLVPGPLQTRAYTATVLSTLRDARSLHDDVDAAVETRMRKHDLLVQGERQFGVVIEYSVLRHQVGDKKIMADQLARLLQVAGLPSVSLGVIPQDRDRSSLWSCENFWVFDDRRVNVELTTGFLTLTNPQEVRQYAQQFDGFRKQALHGSDAIALIAHELTALNSTK